MGKSAGAHLILLAEGSLYSFVSLDLRGSGNYDLKSPYLYRYRENCDTNYRCNSNDDNVSLLACDVVADKYWQK